MRRIVVLLGFAGSATAVAADPGLSASRDDLIDVRLQTAWASDDETPGPRRAVGAVAARLLVEKLRFEPDSAAKKAEPTIPPASFAVTHHQKKSWRPRLMLDVMTFPTGGNGVKLRYRF